MADPDGLGAEGVKLPPEFGEEAAKAAGGIRKRDILEHHKVKLALFERFGVLPGAGDRHLVEFFPGFLTEESGWGKRWAVELTTIADREGDTGRAPDLPPDVVVESMCVADAEGLHPREQVRLPAMLAEWLRRISAAQEA